MWNYNTVRACRPNTAAVVTVGTRLRFMVLPRTVPASCAIVLGHDLWNQPRQPTALCFALDVLERSCASRGLSLLPGRFENGGTLVLCVRVCLAFYSPDADKHPGAL